MPCNALSTSPPPSLLLDLCSFLLKTYEFVTSDLESLSKHINTGGLQEREEKNQFFCSHVKLLMYAFLFRALDKYFTSTSNDWNSNCCLLSLKIASLWNFLIFFFVILNAASCICISHSKVKLIRSDTFINFIFMFRPLAINVIISVSINCWPTNRGESENNKL